MCVNYVKISCERTRATCCKSFEDYSLCGITFFKKDNSILWGMPGSFYMFPYLEPYVSHGGTVCFPAGRYTDSGRKT